MVNPPLKPARSVSWSAIIAGCVAALAVYLLAILLGLGFGIGQSDPMTNEDIVSDFSVGVGIVWSLSALLALWVGGWVAGRGARTTNIRLGGLHRFLVWCTATVIMALFLTSSATALIGGAAKLAGQSVEAVGKGVAVAGKEAAQSPAGSDMLQTFVAHNSDFIISFMDELAAPAAGGQAPALNAGARRDLRWALYRVFSQDRNTRTSEVRAAAVRSITQSARMSEADAQRRLDELISSYDRAQDNLREAKERVETKAREVAERSKRAVAYSAIWTIVAFVIGGISATWGGRRGSSRAWEDVYPETSRVAPPLT